MNRTLNSVLPIVALSVCAGTALSQTVFTQWTFNNTTAASTNTIAGNNPTVAYIGGTAAPLSGQFPSGVANQALSSSGYPLQSMSSGTAGFLFTSRTTNFDAVQVTLFPRGSGSFSRFVSFEYSTNGGTSFTPFQTLTIPGAFLGAPVVIDLSSVPAVSNNPAFQFRLVSVIAVDAFTANSVMFAGNSAYQPVGSGVTQVYGGGQTTTSSTFRVDNVTIQGNPLVSLPPTGTGRGGPVCRGQNVLLTVTPVPGANPVSASYTISANLSGIGGSMTQAFNDQGLDGDAAFGDGVHSYSAAVGIGVTPGQFSLPFSVTDDQARVGNGNIALGVGDCAIDSGQPVVISEVYGGGGAGGAFYRADFVELYNRSANVVSLGGLTVQYASAANPAGFTDVSGVVALSGVINPGQYMLVKMSANGASGIFLPQPDFTVAAGFSGMAAIAARVALTNSATPVGADCANIAILDLVGYGQDAFCFEGAGAVPNLAADLSAARRAGGTQDSNQNFNDFDVTVPIPQGSGNPFPPTVTSPAATPAAACPGATVLLTVVAAAGANPVSLVTSVNGDLSPIGGSMTSAFTDDGLGGDALGGDGIYTFTATIAAGTTPGSKSLLVTATDGENRTGTGTIVLGVGSCQNATSTVVISQVYGGGGNTGAPFNADFVEIYNRSNTGVELATYSVQYAAATSQAFGASGGLVTLTGCIGAGEYRLIRMSAAGAVGAALPTTDFAVGAFSGMSSTNGRVALANVNTALTGCGDAAIVDLVGYGNATCFEGAGAAGVLTNTTANLRKLSGTQDTNENFNDFEALAPAPRNAATTVNPCGPALCPADYNGVDGVNPDDISDYINDYFDSVGIQSGFAAPISIPGGFAGTSTAAFIGFGMACPGASDVPQPNPWAAPLGAYRTGGYKANVGANNAPCSDPNPDDLADFINAYFSNCQ